jgi:hypothetical protein
MEQAVAAFLQRPSSAPLPAFDGALPGAQLKALVEVAQTVSDPATLEMAFDAFGVNIGEFERRGPWLLSKLPMHLQFVFVKLLGRDKAAGVKGLRDALALVDYACGFAGGACAAACGAADDDGAPAAKRLCCEPPAAPPAPPPVAMSIILPQAEGEYNGTEYLIQGEDKVAKLCCALTDCTVPAEAVEALGKRVEALRPLFVPADHPLLAELNPDGSIEWETEKQGVTLRSLLENSPKIFAEIVGDDECGIMFEKRAVEKGEMIFCRVHDPFC